MTWMLIWIYLSGDPLVATYHEYTFPRQSACVDASMEIAATQHIKTEAFTCIKTLKRE